MHNTVNMNETRLNVD